MGRLEGKIAVITGANSGIGLASAKRFVAEGAHVYMTGRRQEELDKAVQAIGTGVTAVQGDVSDLDALDRLFAKVGSAHGRIEPTPDWAHWNPWARSRHRPLIWSSASMSKARYSRFRRASR
jgi:NAD(P)-dependent dehydrogenase (short-subunit alcohol dehydrogenase family)